MPGLHLTVTQRPEGEIAVSLFGPLYRHTIAPLRQVLRHHQSEQVRVELTNCVDIDLDALRALAVARRVARTRGGDLRLCAVPPLIEDRLRRTHMDHLLEPKEASSPEGARAETPGPAEGDA